MDPRGASSRRCAPARRASSTSAIYRDGHRVDGPPSLAETYQRLREQPGTDGLDRALPADRGASCSAVAEEFGLHELAVEDAIVAHQRPKLERYGDTLFVVLRAARYLDDVEEVEFGELHVFVGPQLRAHRPARRRPPTWPPSASGWRTTPSCCAAAPRRCCTRSSTRRRRLRPGGRRAAERHRRDRDRGLRRRPEVSAGASTSCPARSSSSSGPPARCSACSTA